jgi:DNA-directed RNA polymerase subunit RPC12/RpoP
MEGGSQEAEGEVTAVYACPICGRAFKSFAALKLHFGRAHPVDGRGECPLCGKKYVDLRRHIYNKARLGDRAHRIAYGIAPRSRETPFKRECRELAMEALRR